jgi:hypothetical protein
VKEHTPTAGTETVQGTVRKIDESAHQFTLATADGKEATIALESSSMVSGGSFRGLQVGDHVTATCRTEEGKKVARQVTIDSSHP